MIRATLPVVLVIVLAVTAGVLLAQYQAPSAADSAAGQLAAASSHGSGGCCSKAKAGETAKVSLAARSTESQAAGRASGGCPFAAATEKSAPPSRRMLGDHEGMFQNAESVLRQYGVFRNAKECSAKLRVLCKTECSGGKAASCVAAAKCSNREKCPVAGKECSGDKAAVLLREGMLCRGGPLLRERQGVLR